MRICRVIDKPASRGPESSLARLGFADDEAVKPARFHQKEHKLGPDRHS
jgi:hypothetical protein